MNKNPKRRNYPVLFFFKFILHYLEFSVFQNTVSNLLIFFMLLNVSLYFEERIRAILFFHQKETPSSKGGKKKIHFEWWEHRVVPEPNLRSSLLKKQFASINKQEYVEKMVYSPSSLTGECSSENELQKFKKKIKLSSSKQFQKCSL